MTRIDTYRHDIVAFIDDLIRRNELGQPFSLFPHQREILREAFRFDADGRLAYDTVLYACPKKSGKTTMNALITLWWAYTHVKGGAKLDHSGGGKLAHLATGRSS